MKYTEMREEHQKKVSDFLDKYCFFAFNKAQFSKGLAKYNIAEEDAPKRIRSFGGGVFILKEHAKELTELTSTLNQEMEAAAADPDFAYQMCYYELADHEYCITLDVAETLQALGYTLEEVERDVILAKALERAKEAAKGF